MGLLSIAAQNATLDHDYGASKAADAPAAFELALFNGDPTLGGVELDAAGGYARVTMASDGTNFPPAENGQKVCAEVTFPTPTDEWTAAGVADTATHWVLFDAATGDAWDYDELTAEVNVERDEDTGELIAVTVTVQPIIFYGDEQTEDMA
jgi:hypothetical protein